MERYKVDYAKDTCHAVLRWEVSPDAAAVVFEDEQLTYRELNQRQQNSIYLQKAGSRSEVFGYLSRSVP